MKTQHLIAIILTAGILVVNNHLCAEIKLPSVLSSNMVLQQQTEVKLWGEANNKAEVQIVTSWDEQVYTTIADEQGYWESKVTTPAAGGPYSISISDVERVVLENILIGEVWFCSGQSNMEMPMRGFDRQPVKGANTVIAKAKPKIPIRMYIADSEDGAWVRQYSKHPQTDCKGAWFDNTPKNVANTSAVAYYYAQYIQDVLEVPVGIIVSSRGGSKVEAWMSREAIAPFEEVDINMLDNNDEIKKPTSTPCVLYNAKIAPFTKYTIKGFLWYQGESNRSNPDLYARLMPAFVKDLRTKWGVGDFPFYFVEIAPFNYEGADSTSAARLREAQLQNFKEIPNSGMVTTLDVGSPNFIHPVDKETIGTRLAWWALADTYNRKGFGYVPPVYKSMEIADNKIYINIENAQRGLNPMWTKLKGFEIAGDDQVFYPAMAEIETKTCRLAVSSDKVLDPVAVRYAYKNYAEASVFSVYGIPLVPFRTDGW